MAYTKNTWTDGDIVTSEKLNHMEDGIANTGGGAMVINTVRDSTNDTLDKTWQEIYDAMAQGKLCVVRVTTDIPDDVLTIETVISEYSYGGGVYTVKAGIATYTASSATGYPIYIRADIFTIWFDANGGEGEIDDIGVPEGESIETLPDGSELTAPEGKVFGGWATDSEALAADVTAPYTPEESTTLYAVWVDES